MNDPVIEKLVSMLEEEREAIRDDAERRMSVLTDAIDVIRKSRSKPASRSSCEPSSNGDSSDPPRVTVPQRIITTMQCLAADGKYNPDQRDVKCRAVSIWPDEADKIKRGIYAGFTWLLKHSKIVRCVGGFCLPENSHHCQLAGPRIAA